MLLKECLKDNLTLSFDIMPYPIIMEKFLIAKELNIEYTGLNLMFVLSCVFAI